MHHDQFTPRAILTGLAERHRPPSVNVDEEGGLARVGESPAPRALTEASPRVRVEDETVARRQPADPRVPCHTSQLPSPLRESSNARLRPPSRASSGARKPSCRRPAHLSVSFALRKSTFLKMFFIGIAQPVMKAPPHT